MAVSVNYDDQMFAALVLAHEIKKINSKSFIIVGGSDVTYSSLEPKFSREILMDNFGVDAIGIYEGEITLKELAFCIAQHGDLNQVPNLLFHNKNSDQVVATSIVAPPHLDELPPRNIIMTNWSYTGNLPARH